MKNIFKISMTLLAMVLVIGYSNAQCCSVVSSNGVGAISSNGICVISSAGGLDCGESSDGGGDAIADKDGDGVSDGTDVCPETPGIAENKGCPAVQESVKQILMEARNIQFETNSDVIKTESYVKLDNVVAIMKANPMFKLQLDGHTDSDGDDAYNMELSKKRALAARKYLIDNGISSTRISAYGFGETKPLSDNTTVEGKKQNRRVEFNLKF